MIGPQCQSIFITDDSILENDEVFVVALSTTDQDVILNPSISTVVIFDDDGNVNSKMSHLEFVFKWCVLLFCTSVVYLHLKFSLFCIVLLK